MKQKKAKASEDKKNHQTIARLLNEVNALPCMREIGDTDICSILEEVPEHLIHLAKEIRNQDICSSREDRKLGDLLFSEFHLKDRATLARWWKIQRLLLKDESDRWDVRPEQPHIPIDPNKSVLQQFADHQNHFEATNRRVNSEFLGRLIGDPRWKDEVYGAEANKKSRMNKDSEDKEISNE